jgi:hypothetical protein
MAARTATGWFIQNREDLWKPQERASIQKPGIRYWTAGWVRAIRLEKVPASLADMLLQIREPKLEPFPSGGSGFFRPA